VSAVRRRPLRRAAVPWIAGLLVAAFAVAALGVAQSAPADAALADARAALEAAREAPGVATPDVPVWAEALEAARRAVEVADGETETEALRVLASAYQGAGWWVRAVATWDEIEARAGGLSSDERDAWRDAATQLAFARYEAGDLDAAAERFETILAVRPDDVEALRWSGRIALERGRPADAAPRFERLIELRPDDEGARYHLALAEERLARGREASDAFRSGLAAYEAGDLAAAADAFARAESAAPDWTEPLRWRARALLEAERSDAAVEAWAELAERLPDDDDVAYFLDRARLQARVGRPAVLAADAAREAQRRGARDEALDAWLEAREAAPGWREARLGVARAALAAGDGATAEEAWSALLAATDEDDPVREEARQGLATARLMERLGPDAAATYGAALAAYERGEVDAAVDALERVVRVAPDAGPAWTWLGRIAFARGDWAAAARAYERASELAPDDDDLAFFAEEARRLAGPAAESPPPADLEDESE
jgi:tetratricopeptide (TPR) repeat protein